MFIFFLISIFLCFTNVILKQCQKNPIHSNVVENKECKITFAQNCDLCKLNFVIKKIIANLFYIMCLYFLTSILLYFTHVILKQRQINIIYNNVLESKECKLNFAQNCVLCKFNFAIKKI